MLGGQTKPFESLVIIGTRLIVIVQLCLGEVITLFG